MRYEDLSDSKKMQYDVLFKGKTLRQCEKQDRFLYLQQFKKLQKFRLQYIENQEPPKTRLSYYIEGTDEINRNLMSRALARAMFPQYEDDDEIFFEIGGNNESFKGYDGQPVIIWSGIKSKTLLNGLGGIEGSLDMFDIHPIKRKVNTKYGPLNLCQQVNIVNGSESYSDFFDGLAGKGSYDAELRFDLERELKTEVCKCFPLVVSVHDEYYDILLNKGYYA